MAVIKTKLNLDDINISSGFVVNFNGMYYVVNEQTGQYFSNLFTKGPSWSFGAVHAFINIQEANEADERLNGEFRRKLIHNAFGDNLPFID